jgi:methionyl-tRNA formyltransferase
MQFPDRHKKMNPESNMRIIFLGSPEAVLAPLEHLLEAGEKNQVIAVVSQPPRPIGRSKELIDPPIANIAKLRGVPVLQPEKASDPGFLQSLRELKPDLMITAAYGQILTEDFLKIPTRGTINIHPSLLPKYRGATPVPATLLAGDKIAGVTILFTVRKLDAGNIITQTSTEIGSQEKSGALTKRLFELSTVLLSEAIALLDDQNFIGTPQAESAVTHCKKISKEDGFVQWDLSGSEIFNRFRAYSPWPGSYTFLGGKRISIEALEPAASALPRLAPATLQFSKVDGGIVVGTGDGNLVISQLKAAGGRIQDGATFWNGLQSKAGARFGGQLG